MAARTRATGKKSTARKTTTARRSPAARKTTSAVKVSPSPARATATTPVEKKMTAAQSQAVSILTKHGGEMKVSELAAAVVSSGKVKLSGKTPAATVGAQIYTAAKAGRWFRKTKRGHVALLAGASAAS